MRHILAILVVVSLSMSCSQDPSVSNEDALVNGSSQASTSLVVDQANESNQDSDVEEIVKPPELVELEEIWDLAASRPGADVGQVFQLFRLKQSLGP